MRNLKHRRTDRPRAVNRKRHADNAERVTIEGVNIVKRHRRARTADEQSGIVNFPAPVHASNVMLIDPKSGDPTRTRRQIDDDGTKERIAVKSGESIPRSR